MGHVQCGGRAPRSRAPWPCAGGRQDSHRRTKWRAPASNCGRAVPRRDMGAGRPVPSRAGSSSCLRKPLLTAFSALLYLHKREGARLPASPHPIPMPCTRRRGARVFLRMVDACMHGEQLANKDPAYSLYSDLGLTIMTCLME